MLQKITLSEQKYSFSGITRNVLCKHSNGERAGQNDYRLFVGM